MFHLPATFWRVLANQSGLNVGLVLQRACADENLDPEVRDRNVDILARHVEDSLRYQRDLIAKSRNVFLFALINVVGAFSSGALRYSSQPSREKCTVPT
jgi:hypothetical protein